MEYLLFSFPNCEECNKIKRSLVDKKVDFREFDLSRKESKLKIRDYLKVLRRDDKGGIIIPTLILQDNDEVAVVINTREELENWWRSKA
jgi:glutaredoxin